MPASTMLNKTKRAVLPSATVVTSTGVITTARAPLPRKWVQRQNRPVPVALAFFLPIPLRLPRQRVLHR